MAGQRPFQRLRWLRKHEYIVGPHCPSRVMRLVDIQVDEVSMVDKAANKKRFAFVKRDQSADPIVKAEPPVAPAAAPVVAAPAVPAAAIAAQAPPPPESDPKDFSPEDIKLIEQITAALNDVAAKV